MPAVAAVLALAVGSAGCSGDSSADSGDPLVVAAAASLEPAFTAYAEAAGIDLEASYAGSDELAAQIRQGVTPDVYAAANTSLPDELHAADLVAKPVVFATNRLVLAVPEGSQIRSLDQLAEPGTRLAIGDDQVPVGDYAREALDRLGDTESAAILANVRSAEPDVAGIIGKLTQGAVDAGFVYGTDVEATDGALRAVELPQRLRPKVAYGAAVVAGASDPERARRFIDGLLVGAGAAALRRAGFGPPPR